MLKFWKEYKTLLIGAAVIVSLVSMFLVGVWKSEAGDADYQLAEMYQTRANDNPGVAYYEPLRKALREASADGKLTVGEVEIIENRAEEANKAKIMESFQ